MRSASKSPSKNEAWDIVDLACMGAGRVGGRKDIGVKIHFVAARRW